MNTTVTGIDTAKSVFHVFGMNEYGKETFRKRLYRAEVLEFVARGFRSAAL